jgi:hypothetical protein
MQNPLFFFVRTQYLIVAKFVKPSLQLKVGTLDVLVILTLYIFLNQLSLSPFAIKSSQTAYFPFFDGKHSLIVNGDGYLILLLV